ncbi:MAG: hypothetical protein OXJ62_08120 [Spirochaetaceae bacterium]|nr:hypothetical protein [Spirochaetaceae bacterium]
MAAAAVAALLAAALYFGVVLGLQRPVTYPRPPRPPSPPALPAGAEQVWLGPNRDWEAWLLPPGAGGGAPPARGPPRGRGEKKTQHHPGV